MNELPFGDYLAQLLRERDCSGHRLAGMLGIDTNLVYRWLHNEAVPKLAAPYRDMIVSLLDLTQGEAARLKEAQISSLSMPPKKRLKAHAAGLAPPRHSSLAHADTVARSAFTSVPLPASLLRQSHFIWGRPILIETIIRLLEELPSPTPHRMDTVLLSFQGKEEIFEGFPELQKHYRQALHKVLQQGWRVIHFCRLDEDQHRSLALVEELLTFLGTGRYFPYYVERYGTLAPPYDLLIIPQKVAIFCFATQMDQRPDTGLLTGNLQEIELLRAHFDLLQAQSLPLCQNSLPQGNPGSWQAIADAEIRPGGRVSLKEGLSCLTEPLSWYRRDTPLMQGIREAEPVVESIIENQRRRFAAFQTNVVSYPYRDICSKRAIEQLVSSGELPRDDRAIGFLPSPQARREHLQHIIYLLKTYDQYQLAVFDPVETAHIPIEADWTVNGASNVTIIVCAPDSAGKEILQGLPISEPTIVRAFHDYFEAAWRQIAPPNKDKRHVIQWMEQQMALIN